MHKCRPIVYRIKPVLGGGSDTLKLSRNSRSNGVRGHSTLVVPSHHTGSNLGTAWVQLRGKKWLSFSRKRRQSTLEDKSLAPPSSIVACASFATSLWPKEGVPRCRPRKSRLKLNADWLPVHPALWGIATLGDGIRREFARDIFSCVQKSVLR